MNHRPLSKNPNISKSPRKGFSLLSRALRNAVMLTQPIRFFARIHSKLYKMRLFIPQLFLVLITLLVLGNFQCVEEVEEIPFLLRDWQTTWLDNSGSEPLVAENPIPRSAFGIRLSANLSNTGQDTMLFNNIDGVYLSSMHPLQKIELFATDGFDSLPAGADISERFRLRHRTFPNLEYLPLDAAELAYNYPTPSLDYSYRLDLLMVNPPSQPGAYRFNIKISFDSLATPLNRDTFFTLPTVQLQ
jgi:hypothetical protein